ncbi:hypothetical protein N4T57_04115 [Campylobacter hepaticus]|uniref:Periplasmic protein n=1 Tax=Campylobacter hepaticus TaxID=1813019 RepID=A0A6A7JU16_9BACT|nr:hypothetical protein [Campylobacter hepaticus]AXP08502.1 hypothetical protein A2J15_001960 [Campylobacter hepaticus]MCZ0772338.1 hypothetical protein [Campylobacter hepaticus]MCZ0773806.1 hypothetical protein [Campylobacter hepaticus]MCZ0775057.1 hypothetical protein [Campylobacter hepaticus]MDX2322926.1 hypothetical protein [Campylobacter hepaticus]
MKKIFVSVLSSCLLASALSAVSFKEDSLKISFEGYKTKDKVKVEGEFKGAQYQFSKNTKDLATYLKNAKAIIKPGDAYMGEDKDIITHNITKVFFPVLLGNTDIKVVFQDVVEGENKGLISAKVTMDKKSTVIPLSYEIKDKKFEAKGQLDLHTFKNGSKALKALSDAAPGHGGISWPLVDITFSADLAE